MDNVRVSLAEVVNQFISDCKSYGIQMNSLQAGQFQTYFETLVDWNERVNLTAITDPESVYTKHFLDSLLLSQAKPFASGKSLLDVGAGAGFPSVPLKILYPSLPLTILDSLNKRIVFLNELSKQLAVDDLATLHGRAEDYGQNPLYREHFDQVTARAVARLSVLSELCLPFVKQGGYFFALKGPETENEIAEAKGVIKKLGGNLEDIISMSLPREEGERKILVVRKTMPTPKQYPRKAGTPAKSPLQ